MVSPSWTAAIGPPSAASGETCPDHQAAGSAAEAAVGQKRYRSAEAFADNRSRHAQHLAHPGSAFGPFVADDDHVAGLDALSCDRGHGVFFGFENAGRAAMAQAFVAADLRDAAFGREIAVQNDQATSLLQGLVQRRDHFLARRFDAPPAFGSQRLAGDRHRTLVEIFAFQQALHQQADATGAVHVSSDKTSRGLQVGKQRRAFTDFLEIVDVQRDASFARDRQQVQDCIGRTAGGGNARDRVVESMARENVSWDEPPRSTAS